MLFLEYGKKISSIQIICIEIKGQLISEGHFGFFNSSKKQTKHFCLSRLGQKFAFLSWFFGRIEDTKNTFRNYLTFSMWQKC